VNALPVASITSTGGQSVLTCTTPTLNLTASGGITYSWSTNSVSSDITISAANIYSVTVTDANGCTDTESVTITSDQTPPVSTITPAGATTICAGTTLGLQASSGSTYLWSSGAQTQSIQAVGGTYTVTVTGSNGCTAVSSSLTVTEESLIQASAGSDLNGCGASFTLSGNAPATLNGIWTVVAGSANISNPAAFNSTVIFSNPGTAILRWTISSTACGTSSSDEVEVTQLATPAAGTITGDTYACIPASSGTAIFTFSNSSNLEIYSWSLPAGMSTISGSGTNQISVAWTGAAANAGISGQLCVTAANTCSTATPVCTSINYQTVAPVTPGSISGSAKLCPGNSPTFSLTPVARAAQYEWTLPNGLNLTSGSGTNIITANVANGFASGNITVRAINACGNSGLRTKALGLNIPLTPGVITGPVNGLCSLSGITYSTSGTAAATKYLWTIPAGASISGSDSGQTIVVNYGTSSGTISVRGLNTCGVGNARNVTVSVPPARPGIITGSLVPCTGQTYTYGVATVSNADQYNWSVPSGASINGTAPFTKQIAVTYGTVVASNQLVTVIAANSCGNSPVRSLSGIQVSTCNLRESLITPGVQAKVYPSPTSGQFYLSLLLEREEEIEISLLNTTGQLIFSEQQIMPEGEQLFTYDLSNRVGGVYLMRIRTKQYQKVLRVIVQP
jgi:hypothetical protein